MINKIDALIRFFLYVLVFWLPYAPAVIESCVITAFVLWVIKRGTRAWRTKQYVRAFKPAASPLNIPIAVFLFITFLSAAGSGFPEQSLRGLITKTLEWFVIYFLVLEVFTERKHFRIFLGIFLFTSAAVVLDGFVQFYITGKDIFSGYLVSDERVTASFKHANHLAGYLLYVLPLLYVFFSDKNVRRNWQRTAFVVFFLLSVWMLFVTFSRGAWVGFIAGTLFFLFFAHRKYFLPVLAVLIVLGAGIFALSSGPMKKGIRLDAEAVQGTAAWRIGLWEDTAKMIADRPLFGHGPNMYMRVFQEYRRKLGGQFEYDPTYAHNCFLQMTAEVGVLGLLAFLWILYKLFKEILIVIRNNGLPEQEKRLLLGLLAGTFGFLVHSSLDTNFYTLQLSAYFWVMTGAMIALDKSLKAPAIHAIKKDS
jgi:O-antigen ligase